MRLTLALSLLLSLPVLAAGIDVTPGQPLISDALAGVLIFAALSAVAGAWNQLLRWQKKRGKRMGPVGLFFGFFLNGLAANFDQAARQGKAAVAKEPPQ